MDTAELLSSFNGHVDQYAQHREYVRRAKAMGGRFSSSVIEKVILDHEVRASGVADSILPLVPGIEGRISDIDAERASIEGGKADSDVRMEELTLRQAIGEIDEGEFNELSAELRATLDDANGRLEVLDAERADLAQALARWTELAAEGEQPDGTRAAAAPAPAPEPAPAPAPVAAPAPVVEEDVFIEEDVADDEDDGDELANADTGIGFDVEVDVGVDSDDEASADDEGEDVMVGSDDGQYASTEPIKEDMSSLYNNEAGAEDEGGETIEAGDEGVDFGFDVGEDEGDVELNLDGGAGMGDDTGDEIGIDLDVGIDDGPKDEPEADSGDEERRAILLYSEGSPEEQIYPFPGDVLRIGRGRDNDIQIKNDSKVSRFHCQLFRRGGNFYIEDNKSSNGTLVNGELITERRLFGGEEVIIGETFFRFRIM